jgi:hypothetical protein
MAGLFLFRICRNHFVTRSSGDSVARSEVNAVIAMFPEQRCDGRQRVEMAAKRGWPSSKAAERPTDFFCQIGQD